MAKSVLELAVGTGQWDAGLKKAKSALDNFTQSQGGLQQALAKDSDNMRKFVQMMGQMESTAKTSKGQMNDYKSAIEQLTMQYNRMTDAQKQTIGQDYLQAIDQMKQKYHAVNKEIEEMNRSLNNIKVPDLSESTSSSLFSGDKLSGMLQVFGGNLMTKGFELATGAITSMANEIGDCIKQGVELAKQGEGVRIAFERLGRGDILDGLREATHGTVTDIELMKAAVKFNDFKLPIEELGTMLAFAQQKAKDTGQSVDYMVDSIVTGLGRKSLMILDNLGLSAAEIKERMKETGDMTKAVGSIIRDQMAAAGDYVETAADRAAQANVSLQNKMEEVGRKFAPLQEASSQLWTSMKIAILDVVGGPMTTFLNQLTEAGRLHNMLKDINGDSSSGNTKVGQQLGKLKAIKAGGGSDYYLNTTYQGQLEEYNRELMNTDKLLKQFEQDHSSVNVVLQNARKQMGRDFNSIEEIRTYQNAVRSMRDEYAKGGKDIITPKTVTPDPNKNGDKDKTPKVQTETQQNDAKIASLTQEYQKLATAAKTANESQSKGIAERMTAIKGEIQTLQDRNKELKQFAEDAQRIEYPTGSIQQLNQQLQDLQKAQSQALTGQEWQDYQKQIEQTQRQISALKGQWQNGWEATFTVDADDTKAMQALKDVEGVKIDGKTVTVTANTQQAYNQIQTLLKDVSNKKVEIAVTPKIETGTSIQNAKGMQEYIGILKQQLEEADYGTPLYNGLAASLADMTTLQNLVKESLSLGLGTSMFDVADELGMDFWTRAMEGGVENTDWDSIIAQLNEELKNRDLDPIALNYETGEVTQKKKKEGKDSDKEALEIANKMVSGLSQVSSGLSQMGIELPQGVTQVLSGVQGLMSVINGVMTIIDLFSTTSLAAETLSVNSNSVALATNTAALGTLTTALYTTSLLGFSNGGVVKAANGNVVRAANGIVTGTTYSGDEVPALLNAGEVVLNRAQAGALAADLEGGGGSTKVFVEGVIDGDVLRLVQRQNNDIWGRTN